MRSRSSRDLPRRACLSVPGSSVKMLEKAASLDVDMVIIDLEDAVAPLEKADARSTTAASVVDLDWGERVVGVRVNDWTSSWTLADVQQVVEGSGGRLDVIVLPKTEDAAMVRALDLVLAQFEAAAGLEIGSVGIEVQIESAAGVQGLEAISMASPRLEVLALGPLDLAASLGMPGESTRGRARFDAICSAMVVAGRAAGIQVVDGPYARIRDLDGLAVDVAHAVDLGFDGKWALHPDQIGLLHDAFSPTPAELERAEAILAAYEETTATGRGSVLLDGEMIDEASCRIARNIVERGRRGIADHRPVEDR